MPFRWKASQASRSRAMVALLFDRFGRPEGELLRAAVPDAVAGGPRRPYIFGVCRIGRFG